MSTDKWVKCPICNGCSRYPNGIDHLYGNIPVAEYMELYNKIRSAKNDYTVRMDYEVCIEPTGCMAIGASACCTECGAEWIFEKGDIKRLCSERVIK